MWWLFNKNEKKDDEREVRRLAKVRESQLALLSAATSTANAAEDVTALLKSRLDDSLRQIEITAQLLSDALIVCHADGAIDSINTAGERIFGWKKHELQNRGIDQLFRDEDGSPLSGSEIMNKLFFCNESDMENGESIECVKGKRRNGDLFWVEVNISHVARADGSHITILVCRDATQRIETQRQLELNELRFRSMFEASLDGIFVVQNHYIMAANPAIAHMLGHDVECLVAQPLAQYVAPEHRAVVQKLHALRLTGDTTAKTYVIKLIKADGNTVDVLVSSTAMQWDNGQIASLMMIKNIGDLQ